MTAHQEMKLHHCHNCGSTNVKGFAKGHSDNIGCKDCGFEMGVWDMPELVVRQWNLKGAYTGDSPSQQAFLDERSKNLVMSEVKRFREKKYDEPLLQILERLTKVNEFTQVIASCGRKFFGHEDRVAWMERAKNGQLFWHDEWNEKRIYVSKTGPWKDFHNGKTLKYLVESFVEYIRDGKKLPQELPSTVKSKSFWAYDDDSAKKVILAGFEMDLIAT